MTFNAAEFMNTTFEQSLDTRVLPCPEGTWRAQITDVEAREIEIKNGENAGQKRVVMDVTYEVVDEQPKLDTGRDSVKLRQGIFLDLTDSGGLDFSKGKNVRLGKLREAALQNTDGSPWAPSMLKGVVVLIEVTHRLHEGDTFDDVKKVLPAQ